MLLGQVAGLMHSILMDAGEDVSVIRKWADCECAQVQILADASVAV